MMSASRERGVLDQLSSSPRTQLALTTAEIAQKPPRWSLHLRETTIQPGE